MSLALLALTLLVATAPRPAVPSAAADVAEVSLVAGPGAMVPGEPFLVGLSFDLDDGWHTYWKNPGDAGAAPTVEWTLPAGYEAGPLLFPVPIVFDAGGITGYGYADEVTYLTRISPPENAKLAGEITAKVDYLVCDDSVCLPGKAELRLPLPVPGDRLAELDEEHIPRPAEPDSAGTIRLGPLGNIVQAGPGAIVVEGLLAGNNLEFIPDPPPGVVVGSVDQTHVGDRTRLTIETRAMAGRTLPPALPGLLVVRYGGGMGDYATEVNIPLGDTPATRPAN